MALPEKAVIEGRIAFSPGPFSLAIAAGDGAEGNKVSQGEETWPVNLLSFV